jgi:hypothetical protein
MKYFVIRPAVAFFVLFLMRPTLNATQASATKRNLLFSTARAKNCMTSPATGTNGKNLAHDPKYASVKVELKQQLEGWMHTAGPLAT